MYRALYQKLHEHLDDSDIWESVLEPWLELAEGLKEAAPNVAFPADIPKANRRIHELIEFFDIYEHDHIDEMWSFQDLSGIGHFYPETEDGDRYLRDELEIMYAVSRVSDLLLAAFQNKSAASDSFRGLHNTLEQYVRFFSAIGFRAVEVKTFHPFYCEIFDIVESDDPEPQIVEVKWPCMMIENLLLHRAGVVISCNSEKYVKGVADKATLYWSDYRLYRSSHDLSAGWGSNSQWRTAFRRDFDLGDSFLYNADGSSKLQNLKLISDSGIEELTELNYEKRIEFLTHRSHLTEDKGEPEFWPFDDCYEEKKQV